MKNKKPPSPLPAAPAPAPLEKRRRLLWAAGLFAGFLALFGACQDHLYFFDGLLQAGMIINPLDANPPETRYEWNHFLWYPTGRLFYKTVHAAGIKWEGYETLQAFNTLIGAAGAALIFLILSRMAPFPWAALWTVLAALGQVYWYRSEGAENYLTGELWCLAQAWFLLSYWEAPGAAPLLGLAATGLLASYYHLGNFAAWGVAGLAVLLRRPKDRTGMHATALVLLVVLGWLPYALVHHWLEPGGFSKWWEWATALAHGHSTLGGKGGINWNPLNNAFLTLKTLVKCFLAYDEWGWGTTLRLALLVPAAYVAVTQGRPGPDASPRPPDRRPFVFLIPFAAFTALYAVWMPGNDLYWIVQWPSLCLFLGCFSAVRRPGPRAAVSWAALGLMVLIVGQNNLVKVILPNKTNPDAFVVEMSREIGRLTPPQSPVVISGRLELKLKPYIPYFGKRNRLAIELFALSGISQNTDPIQWLNETVVHYLSAGVPVYITDDALRSRDAFDDFKLSPERVESVWKPYVLIPVGDFAGPRPNRLYLMWTPALPPDIEDVYFLRLKMSGLRDQLSAAARARLSVVPASRLAAETRRLEGLTDLRLSK